MNERPIFFVRPYIYLEITVLPSLPCRMMCFPHYKEENAQAMCGKAHSLFPAVTTTFAI